MNIDWDGVKKQTLWSYEDLVKKLQGTLEYGFVQEHYNHTVKQAREYAGKIRSGYLQDKGEMIGYIDGITTHLDKLGTQWSGTTSDLVSQVATRDDCAAFLQRTGFEFDALIQLLNYLMRWVLPFKNPIREFIDVYGDEGARYLDALKKHKLGSNLDLLEAGRSKAGRAQIANTTGIPPVFITGLVHMADISRLAYVRGMTVRHLCGGGYDTLEKLASADLAKMEVKMDTYYHTLGKSLADFKAVIPLEWMIGGAQILPRVVEE